MLNSTRNAWPERGRAPLVDERDKILKSDG
jgi:hypothetical protein